MFEKLIAELAFRASSAPFPLWVGAVFFLIAVVALYADWRMNWKDKG